MNDSKPDGDITHVPKPPKVTTFVTRHNHDDPLQRFQLKPKVVFADHETNLVQPPPPGSTPPPWVDDEDGLVRELYARSGVRLAAVGRALLDGATWRSASIKAGISPGAIAKLRLREPELGRLLEACWEAGTSLLEDELAARALAGAEDRNSMRALELALKTRDAVYRDRAGLDVTVRVAASKARQQLLD